MRALTLAATIGAALFLPTLAHADDRFLLETNANAGANSEVYLLNYATNADLLTNTQSPTSQFLPLNVSEDFSIGDFAYDGSYHVLLESNVDVGANNEVYLLNYASYADLLGNVQSPTSQFLPLNVSTEFSIGGFTYDGSYHLLLESNDNAGANNEVYLLNYASYADLLGNVQSNTSQFLPLNISTEFSLGGFAYNAGIYQVILETNDDVGANNEVYLLNYASYADLLGNVQSNTSQFLPLNISAEFSSRGYEVDTPLPGGGGAIPEPATWMAMILGFGLAGAALRRSRLAAGARAA